MFPCHFLNRRMSLAGYLVFLAAGFAPRSPSASPTLDNVLARIDRQALVELTQKLVRIRSDYSEGSLANHNEIAAFLASELKNLGMEVTVLEPTPRFPMVVGRLAGTQGTPVLGTMGHYNTVPVGDRERWSVDPFGAEIRNSRIYGRGAADQKSGIAALLAATRAIVESGVKLRGTLLHAYIPGEGAQEHVLPLVADAEPERIRADWYLDTDGGPDIIQVAAGHIWLKITVKGKSAHPGGDQPWVNAASKLARLVLALEDVDRWMTYEKHPLFESLGGKPRVVLGTLRAGEAVNQVPDIAEAQIDIRLNPNQTVDGVLGELNALLTRMKADDPELDVTLARLPGTQNVPYHHWASITPDEPLVKVIREVAALRLGREPGFKGSRGGGRPDLWRIGTKWISWSANVGGGSHAPDEWADIEGIQRSAQVYAEILMKILE
jgi:acetylornithine deacetylase/succinyl-diaminopimelate desuccinylase-like protein